MVEGAPDRSCGARYALVAGDTKANHAGRKGNGPDIATAWLAAVISVAVLRVATPQRRHPKIINQMSRSLRYETISTRPFILTTETGCQISAKS